MPMLAHKGAVLTARFNRDGNKFLTGGEDGKARLWDFPTGMLINTFEGHACPVNGVDITSNDLMLCSCDANGEIFFSDLETGCIIRKIRGHDSEVNAVRFNEFESVVVSAGSDHSVRVWDCRTPGTRPMQLSFSFPLT